MRGANRDRRSLCAWCGKPLTGDHPPYLITKDSRIFGPYHPLCLDPATFKLDVEAWKRRHAYGAARPRAEEPRE